MLRCKTRYLLGHDNVHFASHGEDLNQILVPLAAAPLSGGPIVYVFFAPQMLTRFVDLWRALSIVYSVLSFTLSELFFSPNL